MIEKESKLDFDRLNRLGMVEAVWGQHKSYEQIKAILRKFEVSSQLALVTRISKKKAQKLIDVFKKAQYHPHASCLTLGDPMFVDASLGEVLIISGGTSDLEVASEAALSLKMHGVNILE